MNTLGREEKRGKQSTAPVTNPCLDFFLSVRRPCQAELEHLGAVLWAFCLPQVSAPPVHSRMRNSGHICTNAQGF